MTATTITGAKRVARKKGFKHLYVRILLALLPHLLNAGIHLSKRIAEETAYQKDGYTFALTIDGTDLSCICRKAGSRWRALGGGAAEIARCDYVIGFRDIDYAFAVFSGAMSLQDALAARLFSTRGPNDTGVSLTYMFTVLLRTFFFFRGAYKGK